MSSATEESPQRVPTPQSRSATPIIRVTPPSSKTRLTKSADVNPRFPLAYIHYQGDRHLHPERMPSARRERPVSLSLLDCSKNSIDNVRLIAGSLKRLSVRGLKISTLPEKLIDSLNRLERLDFSANRLHDYSIPDNLNALNLVELRFNFNKLTRVPICLRNLPNLSRLDLSHNKIDSLKGIEKAKRLQIIVVDYNLLTTLFSDIVQLRRLEILHCAHNNVRDVERDVRHLRSLKEIDLSCNKITVLPGEIILLPSLETLNLNKNKISKLGVFNIKVHNRHWVNNIDLSENVLAKLPEQLLLMTYNLDVSQNRIKVITGSVLKKIPWRTKQTLNLKNNPIMHPPQEVCYSGIGSIVQFFLEAKLESKVRQGVKVIVLGKQGCGKTSLVQSMLDQQPRIENHGASSAGIESQEITCEKDSDSSEELQLTVWDFCGNPFYTFPHYIFSDQPSVTLVTFDIAGYRSELFYDKIGFWIDWVMTRTNKIAVILVGTKTDVIEATEAKDKLDKINRDAKSFFAHRKCQLDKLVKRIENRPYISSALSEQLKHYMNVLNAPICLYPVPVATSSKDYSGFTDLKLAIKTVSSNVQFFPNIDRIVPTFWLDVQQFLEDSGNAMYVPVMKWSDYEQEVTSRFGMKHILVHITTYLHETGKVLWFRDVSSLKDLVFIRPSWLFDIFRNLIRHDVNENLSFNQDENFLQSGYLENRFKTAKEEFSTQGVCEIAFVKALVGSVIPMELQQPFIYTVQLLINNFNLAIPVSRNTTNTGYVFQKLESNEEAPKISRLLFPCYRKAEKPPTIGTSLTSLTGQNRLIALFRFPYYYPPGTFELLCARLCKSKHDLTLVDLWTDGVHGRHSNYGFKILVTRGNLAPKKRAPVTHNNTAQHELSIQSKRQVGENNESRYCISLRLIWDSSEQKVTGTTVWSVFLPLLHEVEDILSRFSGVWVSRHMLCPFCGEPSFYGEWLSPKETQNMSVKPCEACGELVDTTLLVQPRQRKREDIMKKLAAIQSEIGTKTARAVSSHENKSLRSILSDVDSPALRSKSDLT